MQILTVVRVDRPTLDMREGEGILDNNEIRHRMTFTFCQNEFLVINSGPDNGEDRHIWKTKSGLKSLEFCYNQSAFHFSIDTL